MGRIVAHYPKPLQLSDRKPAKIKIINRHFPNRVFILKAVIQAVAHQVSATLHKNKLHAGNGTSEFRCWQQQIILAHICRMVAFHVVYPYLSLRNTQNVTGYDSVN